LPEDDPDQRGKREDDQKFLRLQTEAQTIHGGTSRERKRGGTSFRSSFYFHAKTDSSIGSCPDRCAEFCSMMRNNS
jgi:hypothetical protein